MIKYAFFDVDQTIYPGYSANDFINTSVEEGFCEKIMRERMNAVIEDLTNGELNYHDASQEIMNILGDITEGKKENEVDEIVDKLIEKVGFVEWFIPLYEDLKREGYEIYLVSGGASFIIERLAENIDSEIKVISTEYKIDLEGRYYTHAHPIINGQIKADKIREIITKEKTQEVFSIAFGDSEGDIPMLNEVNQGYLYLPGDKEKVSELARESGYVVFNETGKVEINRGPEESETDQIS